MQRDEMHVHTKKKHCEVDMPKDDKKLKFRKQREKESMYNSESEDIPTDDFF